MDREAVATWLDGRLAEERLAEDWIRLVKDMLEVPLAQLFPLERFERGLEALLTEARLAELGRAAFSSALEPAIAEVRSVDTALGAHLDAEGREHLRALARRPGLVDEEWVDVVLSQPATEELFADTLFRGLEDFSDLIPNLVQGLTPAALGKIASRLGGSKGGGMGSRLREDLRGRIEPEIRKFVQRATRRLLDGTAGFVKSRLDSKEAAEARVALLDHALERSGGSFARQLDAEALEHLEGAWMSVTRSGEGRAELKRRLLSVHGQLLERYGAGGFSGLLAAEGAEVDAEAWARATLPAVLALTEAPPVRSWLVDLIEEAAVSCG